MNRSKNQKNIDLIGFDEHPPVEMPAKISPPNRYRITPTKLLAKK